VEQGRPAPSICNAAIRSSGQRFSAHITNPRSDTHHAFWSGTRFPVLADQAVDDAGVPDTSGDIDHGTGLVQRRSLFPRLMQTMLVVMPRVLGQGPPKVSFAADQQVVQALSPWCSYEPLRKGIRPWRLDRRLDDPNVIACEHIVEDVAVKRPARVDPLGRLCWSELVVRGGVEPPTFRFSGLRTMVQLGPSWSPCLRAHVR